MNCEQSPTAKIPSDSVIGKPISHPIIIIVARECQPRAKDHRKTFIMSWPNLSVHLSVPSELIIKGFPLASAGTYGTFPPPAYRGGRGRHAQNASHPYPAKSSSSSLSLAFMSARVRRLIPRQVVYQRRESRIDYNVWQCMMDSLPSRSSSGGIASDHNKRARGSSTTTANRHTNTENCATVVVFYVLYTRNRAAVM